MSWRPWFATLLAILPAAALLTGCPAPKGNTAQGQEVLAAPAAIAVEMAAVQTVDVEEALELVGAVKSKFEATVRSEYAGTLSDVFITEWVKVKKGEALAKIDMRETEAKVKEGAAVVAQARADLLSAQAAAERAGRDFKRAAQLKAEEIVSEQNLDEARQQRDATAAQVEAARARLDAAQENMRQSQVKVTKSVLLAPMDGVVANRHANVGQFVDNMGQGEPLFRIVDNRLLDVTLTVPSTELSRVSIGQPLQFTTDFLPGKIFTAKVTHINPAADPATRAVSIVAEIENTTGELRDGLFVKGRLVVGQRKNVLQIPRLALLSGSQGAAGKAELFVLEGDKAVKRTVQTGREGDETIEITAGLKLGDKVVTRGAFMLQDGDLVKVVAEKSLSL